MRDDTQAVQVSSPKVSSPSVSSPKTSSPSTGKGHGGLLDSVLDYAGLGGTKGGSP
jgi:hypothetical protein